MLDKLERKEKRRTAARGGDLDLDWLNAHGFDEVVEAEVQPWIDINLYNLSAD